MDKYMYLLWLWRLDLHKEVLEERVWVNVTEVVKVWCIALHQVPRVLRWFDEVKALKLVVLVWLDSNQTVTFVLTNATPLPRLRARVPTREHVRQALRHAVVVWLVSNQTVRLVEANTSNGLKERQRIIQWYSYWKQRYKSKKWRVLKLQRQ